MWPDLLLCLENFLWEGQNVRRKIWCPVLKIYQKYTQNNRIRVWELLFYSIRIYIFLNYFLWSEQEQWLTYKNIKRIMKCLDATYTTGKYFTITKSSVRKHKRISHKTTNNPLTFSHRFSWHFRPSTHNRSLHRLARNFTVLYKTTSRVISSSQQ